MRYSHVFIVAAVFLFIACQGNKETVTLDQAFI